jgi:hypothetical protein
VKRILAVAALSGVLAAATLGSVDAQAAPLDGGRSSACVANSPIGICLPDLTPVIELLEKLAGGSTASAFTL